MYAVAPPNVELKHISLKTKTGQYTTNKQSLEQKTLQHFVDTKLDTNTYKQIRFIGKRYLNRSYVLPKC